MDKGRAAEKRMAKAAQSQRDALADKMIKPIVDALQAEDQPPRYKKSDLSSPGRIWLDEAVATRWG